MARPRPGMDQDADATAGAVTVLFVATDLSTGGGVNKVIRDLAVMFTQRLGIQVKVVNARSGREPSYGFPAAVPVEQHRRQSLGSYFKLLLSLRRHKADYVVSSWTQDNVLTTLAFLFSSTRTILVEHSSWHFHKPAIRFLRRITYPLAWRVVVLNRRDLQHYAGQLRNVRMIPNPVTAPAARPHVPREKLILAIGHLEPSKNFEDAIRAMARSGLEAEGWSLEIIGSGSCESQLHELIAELGLDRTRIHSPSDDLGSWYARASLLVLPSRIESFSLVLAEAMLSGVVPVAYASDGPSFILEDFPDQLVEIGDVDALAGRLARFASKPDLEPLRRNLQASVERRFSADRVARQWVELLK